jgi:hypothetical protein
MKTKISMLGIGLILTLMLSGEVKSQNCTSYFVIDQNPIQDTMWFYGYANLADSMDYVTSWTWTINGMGVNYTYNVQNFHLIQSGLAQGYYTVCLEIQTNLGCSDMFCDSLNIGGGNPCPISITDQVYHVTTPSGNDGGIDITVSNGTAPYSFIWSTGETTEDIYNLSSGYYSVTVSDINCSAVWGTYILEPWDSSFVLNDTLWAVVDTCFGFTPDSFYISQVVLNGNSVTITWVFTGGGNTFTLDVVYQLPPGGYGNYVAAITINCNTKSYTLTYMSYVNIYETMTIGEFDNEILFYPNPANNYLIISPDGMTRNVRIFNLQGVLAGSYSNPDNIDLSNFAEGMYILEIETVTGTHLHKLIITR